MNALKQGPENYGPWVSSVWLLVFLCKVLLKHGHTHLFNIVCGCLHSTQQCWVADIEARRPAKPEIFTLLHFREKITDHSLKGLWKLGFTRSLRKLQCCKTHADAAPTKALCWLDAKVDWRSGEAGETLTKWAVSEVMAENPLLPIFAKEKH